jgi:hypothetical protein
MRVLIACEFSGVVRDAFRARGHDAVSCDLLPSERPGPHIVGDVRDHFADGWDLLIAHPPCTFLANSGAKHLYLACRRENGAAGDRWANLVHAAAFFLDMLRAPIPRIAVENPIMLGHVRRLFDIPAPSQTIQPWQHGHPETKATCLWLRSLPRLRPTHVVDGHDARVHREPPGPDRWRNRSRTYPGHRRGDGGAVGWRLRRRPPPLRAAAPKCRSADQASGFRSAACAAFQSTPASASASRSSVMSRHGTRAS